MYRACFQDKPGDYEKREQGWDDDVYTQVYRFFTGGDYTLRIDQKQGEKSQQQCSHQI
jgi:hypothetical protein